MFNGKVIRHQPTKEKTRELAEKICETIWEYNDHPADQVCAIAESIMLVASKLYLQNPDSMEQVLKNIETYINAYYMPLLSALYGDDV